MLGEYSALIPLLKFIPVFEILVLSVQGKVMQHAQLDRRFPVAEPELYMRVLNRRQGAEALKGDFQGWRTTRPGEELLAEIGKLKLAKRAQWYLVDAFSPDHTLQKFHRGKLGQVDVGATGKQCGQSGLAQAALQRRTDVAQQVKVGAQVCCAVTRY